MSVSWNRGANKFALRVVVLLAALALEASALVFAVQSNPTTYIAKPSHWLLAGTLTGLAGICLGFWSFLSAVRRRSVIFIAASSLTLVLVFFIAILAYASAYKG